MMYAWPESHKPMSIHRYSANYVEPIFSQRWSMFAPCPTINTVIEVNYKFSDSDSSGWIRPSKDAVEKHSSLPFLHYGELVIAEANLDYWLSVDLKEMGLSVSDPFPFHKANHYQKGYSYFKVRNYIEGWGDRLYNKPYKAAQIRFIRTDVVTGEQGVVTLPIYNFDHVK